MQALAQNKQPIWYALYTGKTDLIVGGLKTGEKDASYTDPVKIWVNVSASRGTADIEQFGINENYERTICTDDVECPIAEDSLLWVGIEPTDGQTQNPHNYKVVRVARSLNSVLIAIRKVSVE